MNRIEQTIQIINQNTDRGWIKSKLKHFINSPDGISHFSPDHANYVNALFYIDVMTGKALEADLKGIVSHYNDLRAEILRVYSPAKKPSIIRDLELLNNPILDLARETILDRTFDVGKLRQAHSKINDALQCGGFYHAETIERMRRCKRALYKLIIWLEYKDSQRKARELKALGFVRGSYYDTDMRG